ncbi:MAG: hypothetical protein R3313_01185 [Candidatus Saccharimonadales bacterium]|nr:hypothetical protein [Candidatus Saccharimonadales bacterium]
MLASTINLDNILSESAVLHLYCDTTMLRVASLFNPEAFYEFKGTNIDTQSHQSIGRGYSIEKALHRAVYTLRTGRQIQPVRKPRKVLGRQLQLSIKKTAYESSSLIDQFISVSGNEITLTRDHDESVIATMSAFEQNASRVTEFVGIHKSTRGALMAAMKAYSKNIPAKILDPPTQKLKDKPMNLNRSTIARITRRTDRVSKAKIEMPGQKAIKVVF